MVVPTACHVTGLYGSVGAWHLVSFVILSNVNGKCPFSGGASPETVTGKSQPRVAAFFRLSSSGGIDDCAIAETCGREVVPVGFLERARAVVSLRTRRAVFGIAKSTKNFAGSKGVPIELHVRRQCRRYSVTRAARCEIFVAATKDGASPRRANRPNGRQQTVSAMAESLWVVGVSASPEEMLWSAVAFHWYSYARSQMKA